MNIFCKKIFVPLLSEYYFGALAQMMHRPEKIAGSKLIHWW